MESGQIEYGGWSTAGVNMFMQIFNFIKQARASDDGKTCEENILHRVRQKNNPGFVTAEEYLNSKKKRKKSPTSVVQEVDLGMLDDE